MGPVVAVTAGLFVFSVPSSREILGCVKVALPVPLLPKSSTIQHLRFPFSLLLAPVFLWALLELLPLGRTESARVAIAFLILHILVYPASNGFNSYWDRDEGAIGGIEKPLPVTRELLLVSTGMDALAVVLAFALLPGWRFGLLVLAYIAASRAYSHPAIRWKARPWLGWSVVAVFQGAVVFAATCEAAGRGGLFFAKGLWIPALLSSLLLGASYPLTQVYQHAEDARRGDLTLSRLLGVRGTFVFSIVLNALALGALACWWLSRGRSSWLALMLAGLTPGGAFLLRWAVRAWRDENAADHAGLSRMNRYSALGWAAGLVAALLLELRSFL